MLAESTRLGLRDDNIWNKCDVLHTWLGLISRMNGSTMPSHSASELHLTAFPEVEVSLVGCLIVCISFPTRVHTIETRWGIREGDIEY